MLKKNKNLFVLMTATKKNLSIKNNLALKNHLSKIKTTEIII